MENPTAPNKSKRDLLARSLASHVREAHGEQSATTFDQSSDVGEPRGYAPCGNLALERALGTPGIPLGRITEISGWEAAGKSTCLDQILAATQKIGGLCVIADTERARNRAYMSSLGIAPESLIWIGGRTVEAMFEEIETLARTAAHYNAVAWHEALVRSGVKVPQLPVYRYVVYDLVGTKKKVSKSYDFCRWQRGQSSVLYEFQKANNLPATGKRDKASREMLRPVILYGDTKSDNKAALADWIKGVPNELAQPADRPIVIGWDSVAGTATEAELAGDAHSVHVATAARVIRKCLRRSIQLIDDEAISLILINQRYAKLATGGTFSWGKQSETYGGGGIKYHSTIRAELERMSNIWGPGSKKANGDPPCGQEVMIKVPKNKLNDPHRTERYGLIFGKGAVDAYAIYSDLKERGILRAGGAWSKFTDTSILGEEKSFRGWTELNDMMEADPDLNNKLRAIYLEGR